MSQHLSGTQIERFRLLYEQFQRDTAWQAHLRQQDARREVVRKEMLELLQHYLAGQIDNDVFKATFDQKTRTVWEGFGLKAMSGAMFLNMLVKHIPDQDVLAQQLRAVLPVPQEEAVGQTMLRAFHQYLKSLVTTQIMTRRLLQPVRAPFFVSAWWHMQQREQWPIFYTSGQAILEQEGVWTTSPVVVTAYFSFRSVFLALMQALGLHSWELEHLLAWLNEKQASLSPNGVPEPQLEPPQVAEPPAELPIQQANMGHAQMQWQLAKIG